MKSVIWCVRIQSGSIQINAANERTVTMSLEDILAQVAHASERIERIKPESRTVDVMGGDSRRVIKVHNHGFMALVDVMPRRVPRGKKADSAIVQAARVSYGQGTKKQTEDDGLIRYLMRHRHTTPLEMVEFKFHMCMPIFVARQWIRHRTANVNEYSGRYSIMPDWYFRPEKETLGFQSKSNRQGREAEVHDELAERFFAYLDAAEQQHQEYLALEEAGLAREIARIGLPSSLYTEWFWKCDLHNIFHFLGLRMDPHAQQEIRDYANAMFALIQPIVPTAAQAFLDYQLGGTHLSRLEIEALASGMPLRSKNKREQNEWAAKMARLGIE